MHTLNITAQAAAAANTSLVWERGPDCTKWQLASVPNCQRRMHLAKKWNGRQRKKKQACYYNMALSGTPVPSEKSRSCMKQMLLVPWGTKVVTHPQTRNKGTAEYNAAPCELCWPPFSPFPNQACTCQKDHVPVGLAQAGRDISREKQCPQPFTRRRHMIGYKVSTTVLLQQVTFRREDK